MLTTHKLSLLHDQTPLTIAKLKNASELPTQPNHLFQQVATHDEISIVAPSDWLNQQSENCIEKNEFWQAIKIDQQLEFDMVGIIAQLAQPLAENNLSIFVISTFNTDYLLVKKEQIGKALALLRQQGHNIQTKQSLG